MVDIGLGLGFMIGSLALLALVLYVTRVRGPTLPHEAAETDGSERDAAAPRAGAAAAHTPTMEQCELCGENPASRSVNDMLVCAECDEELLT